MFASYNTKIMAYVRPGFHPTDIPMMPGYPVWLEEYQRSGSPQQAVEALLAKAACGG